MSAEEAKEESKEEKMEKEDQNKYEALTYLA